MATNMDPIYRLTPSITLLPVIHGSGDYAVAVRRVLLELAFDRLVVPLPPSFQAPVEAGILELPSPGIVIQDPDTWEHSDEQLPWTYVPIDPCQPVLAAIRSSLEEHRPVTYADQETPTFVPTSSVLPDTYALRQVAIHRFSAAILPALERPEHPAILSRIVHFAARLRGFATTSERILALCSMHDWPWIRESFFSKQSPPEEWQDPEQPSLYGVVPKTLIFLFGEIPWITGLYEQARQELNDDTNLSVDGVKDLLLAARTAYRKDFRHRARSITPQALGLCLRYMRNLSLLDRRLTPDLYTVIMASKQVLGDSFALHVAELAREYPYDTAHDAPLVSMGIDSLRLRDQIRSCVSRLPGSPIVWRSLRLKRRPDRDELKRWSMQWNPYSQCSWPPEDDKIESFRSHVVERAKQIMGSHLTKSEKFTTSVKDGIDLRETLRNWHTGDIYVKEHPTDRGTLDAVVMLFDAPADPRDYPWRTTWFAEHKEESTLAFFASDFRREPIGPGICQATYGGALFLFPPVTILDIWTDPRLEFTETLEERILAAACLHSRGSHIALMSQWPPGAGYRRLARRFKKKWVHVPLSGFGQSTIQQLRMVHVLNGKEVRSFAAHFIRQA
jgi:hypothetical protein